MTYTQRWYHNRLAEGLCLECGGKRGKDATKTRCADCASDHRKRQKKRDAKKQSLKPVMVAKSDADALANALQELAEWYKSNIGLPAVAANAALHSYRTKYPQ